MVYDTHKCTLNELLEDFCEHSTTLGPSWVVCRRPVLSDARHHFELFKTGNVGLVKLHIEFSIRIFRIRISQ